jgi:hypothetical protein
MAGDTDRAAGMTPLNGGDVRSPDAGPASIGWARTGRRRFLAGVGATGLAVATATFGRSTPAFAATSEGCCDLTHPPGNDCYTSYTTCSADAAYIWVCTWNVRPPQTCHCCESKAHSNDHICPHGKSSASCTNAT